MPNPSLPPGYTVDPPAGSGVPPGYTVDPLPPGARLPAKYGGDILDRMKGSVVSRNAPPIAAQTGGQIIGELLGTALAPETSGLSELLPIALGATGAGIANVGASKLLPEKYGGTPGESSKAAFLYGAVPAAIGSGTTRAIGARMEAKATKAAAEDAATFAKKAAETAKAQHETLAQGIAGAPPDRASVARAGRLLGSPSGGAVAPLVGEARTAATNEATDAVLGPINRLRTKLGEPIGDAYKNLKDPEQEITPAEAQQLSEGARNIRDSSLSPSPKAVGIIRQLQRFGVTEGDEAPSAIRSAENMFGGENLVSRGQGRVAPRAMSSFTPQQMAELDKITATGRAPTKADYERIASIRPGVKTATYDDLRELRQHIGERLKTATGGDAHNLRALQQQIDNILVDKLPDNMGALRNSYRGFIKNYPYSDINRLRAAGTPEEVADWLYSRNPSVTNEIIRNGTPEEQATYRRLFAQKVLTKIDPEAPAATQQAVLKQQLSPYLKNNTAQSLYGPQTAKELSDIVHMPVRRAVAAKALQSPQGQQLFTSGFMDQATKSGKADIRAAAKGYQLWFDSLPPEQQAVVRRFASPLSQQPDVHMLPSPAQSYAERLKQPIKSSIPVFATRAALGGMAGAALGFAKGGGYMENVALGFALFTTGAAGYNALMKAGGADLLAKLYLNPASRALGAQAFKTLVLLGGRAAHQEVEQPTQ